MDKFVARENIKRLRVELASELDPNKRSALAKLLVEEEDRLGADLELLADLDGQIRKGRELIARQTALVAAMERGGNSGIRQARALLAALAEAQELHERYRQKVLIAIEESEL